MVRVNDCVTVPAVLVAVKVTGQLPVTVEVPVRLALPVPFRKVTPAGRVPDSEILGAGIPVAFTTKVNAMSAVAETAWAVVKAGTMSVPKAKYRLVDPDVVVAVTVRFDRRGEPTAAVPEMVAVPSWSSVN